MIESNSRSGLDIVHTLVTYDAAHWDAVPANNGGNGPIWQSGDELLVGFSRGVFSGAGTGHQCDNAFPFESWLARSRDGGGSWHVWRPSPYAGLSQTPQHLTASLDVSAPGFVMRVEGNGYHGNTGAQWFYSHDAGESWRGPYEFGNLLNSSELAGLEFTARTAYLVNGPRELDLYLSVRSQPADDALTVVFSDKPFLARSTDGGLTFEFVSWIVPRDDPARAVMPAPVRLSDGYLVVALRRRSPVANWIDCYTSTDDGWTWAFLSKVADTTDDGRFNGNPPALIRLADGRLCCAYGNRSHRQIRARFSEDAGATWGPELILRDDFRSANGSPDLGYCRLFQRSDGSLVVVYFWCTADRPETHIEATVLSE